MRVNSSITLCLKCEGESQIVDVQKQDTQYVRRIRVCKGCGARWTTAEIHLAEVKNLKALNKFLKAVK